MSLEPKLYNPMSEQTFNNYVSFLSRTPMDALTLDENGFLREKTSTEKNIMPLIDCCRDGGRKQEKVQAKIQLIALNTVRSLVELKNQRLKISKEEEPEFLEIASLLATSFTTNEVHRDLYIPFTETTENGLLIDGAEITRQQILKSLFVPLKAKRDAQVQFSATESKILVALKTLNPKSE